MILMWNFPFLLQSLFTVCSTLKILCFICFKHLSIFLLQLGFVVFCISISVSLSRPALVLLQLLFYAAVAFKLWNRHGMRISCHS